MGDLLINLPTNIKKVLENINFNIVDSELKSPFYFATYSEVKMRGWDTAHLNLKANLENLIQILNKDKSILNKEKKNTNIEFRNRKTDEHRRILYRTFLQ